MAPQFSFCVTELMTLDSHISAPSGIVYSTNPRKAGAVNGKTYVVKGPEVETVFAEIAGCMLAAAVEIPVPPVALCLAEENKLAGSENVEQSFRDASIPLKRPAKVANMEDLYNVIVVDCWLGNTDRNLGNVLALSSSNGGVELVMIDFEKAATLRPHPRIKSTMIEYRKLWPTDELGQRAKELRPMVPPPRIVERISRLTEDPCREILNPLITALENVTWAEDSIGAVAQRSRNIQRIVEEVWRSI